MHPRTLHWDGDALVLIDQTRLPLVVEEIRCTTVPQVIDAIKRLAVRGAPAIGVAGAYGVALAARTDMTSVAGALDALAASRPTAVNLFWALDRMRRVYDGGGDADALVAEAQHIHEDDQARCRRIAEFGEPLMPGSGNILTHCNAGALATAGMGTALAPVYLASERGKKLHVFVDETRPLLQGSRITAWELMQAGIPCTLITDNMAGAVMKRRGVSAVIVGADRIAANGDVANKIGTYALAIVARHHGVPFYVAAPLSTIDPQTATGDAIPIEERADMEVTEGFGRRTAPVDVAVFNPAFDVTPHDLVTAIITDRGVVPATAEGIRTVTTHDRRAELPPGVGEASGEAGPVAATIAARGGEQGVGGARTGAPGTAPPAPNSLRELAKPADSPHRLLAGS